MSEILGGVSTNTECASNIDLTITGFGCICKKNRYPKLQLWLHRTEFNIHETCGRNIMIDFLSESQLTGVNKNGGTHCFLSFSK